MAIERMQKAKPDEPPAPISDVDIYVKIRKRDQTREYKLPTDAVLKKIEDVEKFLKDGSVVDANKLVRIGKAHSRSYLVGRLIRKKEAKGKIVATTSNISDQYMATLTEKIQNQIAQEMEEKLEKKVRDNVKKLVSKLAEKNPQLQLDIDEELSDEEPPNDGDASGANSDTP